MTIESVISFDKNDRLLLLFFLYVFPYWQSQFPIPILFLYR